MDITSEDLCGIDTFVHFAAHSVQFPFDSLSSCLQWNLLAVLELFEKARIAGIKRFIVAGSCFEYGQTSTNYSEIPTSAPLNPANSYAASKAAASIVLKQWAVEHDLSLEILRVFHVYGDGEPENRLWPSLRRAATAGQDFQMTKGEQVRDFIYVKDVASAFLQRATEGYLHDEKRIIYNLGSGKPISIREFAEYWWHTFAANGRLLLGSIPYRPLEVMRYVAGPELIRVESRILQ